MKADADFELY